MDRISFSIVVATKSRVRLLTELIESIDVARKNYSGDCEVLIVDDSIPEESEAVQAVCREHDCKYIFYENSVSAKEITEFCRLRMMLYCFWIRTVFVQNILLKDMRKNIQMKKLLQLQAH